MFKNNVFSASVSTKNWIKKAAVRAIKTMAQTAVSLIGADAVTVYSLDWKLIVGASLTSGLLSVLTSIAGLPEVGDDT